MLEIVSCTVLSGRLVRLDCEGDQLIALLSCGRLCFIGLCYLVGKLSSKFNSVTDRSVVGRDDPCMLSFSQNLSCWSTLRDQIDALLSTVHFLCIPIA
jgi:hypothetical protein